MEESNYLTYDKEMVAQAPILKDFDYSTTNWEEKEKTGPFHPVFLADTKKVWSILHVLWSTTGAWMHVKTLDKAQNGRQVYRALHKVFFGGNKRLSMTTAFYRSFACLPTPAIARTTTSTSM